MARQERVIVIGGGIGGLAAAAALHQKGSAVTVLERAPALDPVGAAISLAPNALRALDVLGIGDEIRDLAAWQGDGGLRTPGGRWLSRSSAEAAAARFGGPPGPAAPGHPRRPAGRPAPARRRPHRHTGGARRPRRPGPAPPG